MSLPLDQRQKPPGPRSLGFPRQWVTTSERLSNGVMAGAFIDCPPPPKPRPDPRTGNVSLGNLDRRRRRSASGRSHHASLVGAAAAPFGGNGVAATNGGTGARQPRRARWLRQSLTRSISRSEQFLTTRKRLKLSWSRNLRTSGR
jgi:hypothetical protein